MWRIVKLPLLALGTGMAIFVVILLLRPYVESLAAYLAAGSGGGFTSEIRTVSGGRTGELQHYFTCSRCGSTMSSRDEQLEQNSERSIIYQSPTSLACTHVWEAGVSSAHPSALPDGTLVLVKQGDVYGAFILRKQRRSPAKVVYQWWYRDDGRGDLDDGSAAVVSGEDVCDLEENPSATISFGPFRVEWSENKFGRGFIYYKYKPGESVPPSDLRMRVTNKIRIDGIDAADPQWQYKGTPVE